MHIWSETDGAKFTCDKRVTFSQGEFLSRVPTSGNHSVHNICISSKAKAISSWPFALGVSVLANSCR